MKYKGNRNEMKSKGRLKVRHRRFSVQRAAKKLVPGPHFFYRSEIIVGADDKARALTIDERQDIKHLCDECYTVDYANQCPKCKRFICEACSDWEFHPFENMKIIDVKCPCMKLLYNDFC